MAFTLYLASALYAQADAAVFEAGVQAGALDERDALREKPVIAGGHAGVRLWRFVGAEPEINRLPIGGAAANFPATEFLFGAKLGYRIGPLGLFGTVRPGLLHLDVIGSHPEVNLGVALEGHSRIFSLYGLRRRDRRIRQRRIRRTTPALRYVRPRRLVLSVYERRFKMKS